MTVEVSKVIREGFCKITYVIFDENMNYIKRYTQRFYWEEG